METRETTPEQVKIAIDEIAEVTWKMIHAKADSIGLKDVNEKWLFVNRVLNFHFCAANQVRFKIASEL